jgi:phospho-N-acetylmuramoyl-pentapeptide-transferase
MKLILTLFEFNIIKILLVSSLTFFIALLSSPPLIKFLNKINFWKKEPRKQTITGEEATVFYQLHKERETTIPRGGGVLVWIPVLILILLFNLISRFQKPWWIHYFNFLSRKETWLPLFSLITGSIIGLVDDTLTVLAAKHYKGGGMSFWQRFFLVFLIGLIGGSWFYYKLGWNTIYVPFLNFPRGGEIYLGHLSIPLFIIVTLACWAGGVVDGVDGLAGGIFAAIFSAFSIIAFSQGKIDLATFCASIVGAIFGFLWYNIPPARFYMGETGILGLSTTLAVVAFLTDSVFILPIIGGVLVIEVGSIILQLLSKKIRKKKIWLATPIHHHFEAKGWPPYQVTMRFWILGVIFAVLGVAIRLLK